MDAHVPTIGDFKVPELAVERNYTNTFSLRLGGSVIILPKKFTIRAGYIFESSASPDQYHSVFLLDAVKHLLAIGVTWQWKKIAFDFTYAHIFHQTRRIKNSKYKQINLLNPEGAIVIGNGIYRAS